MVTTVVTPIEMPIDCPFCGCSDVKPDDPGGGDFVAVQCGGCEAWGPLVAIDNRRGEAEAVRLWNQRAQTTATGTPRATVGDEVLTTFPPELAPFDPWTLPECGPTYEVATLDGEFTRGRFEQNENNVSFCPLGTTHRWALRILRVWRRVGT